MACTANVELVSADTIDIALKEMVARGQIASAPISKRFEWLDPILDRAGVIDDCKYVDFALRGQFGYRSAPDVMHLQ